MKNPVARLVLPVSCGLVLAAVLAFGVALSFHDLASAQEDQPPHVAVYLKNFGFEFDEATTDFLATQFVSATSPAHNAISYTIVSTITQAALGNSTALVIDESSDMSLTADESRLIHEFVNRGGKVGLFTLPWFYYTTQNPWVPNPAAYQGVADLFGNATIGAPVPAELSSHESSAMAGGFLTAQPYNILGGTLTTLEQDPFSPITAAALPVLKSSVTGLPVAVINPNGILMTTPIGDPVPSDKSNDTYRKFVVNAIVWLAQGAPLHHLNLPVITKN